MGVDETWLRAALAPLPPYLVEVAWPGCDDVALEAIERMAMARASWASKAELPNMTHPASRASILGQLAAGCSRSGDMRDIATCMNCL